MRLLPFEGLLPGVWEGRQCTQPIPAVCTKGVPNFPPKMVWAAPTTTPSSRWSQGPLRPKNSEQSSTSSLTPLGRNERRKQGVVLSYVTSFLESEALAVTARALGRGWGRGRRLSSLPLPPLLQTLTDLSRQACCFPSAPAPRRHLPPGVGNQEGLLS